MDNTKTLIDEIQRLRLELEKKESIEKALNEQLRNLNRLLNIKTRSCIELEKQVVAKA